MAAKKKPVQVLALADLGLTEAEAGLAASVTEVTGFSKRPPRQAGQSAPTRARAASARQISSPRGSPSEAKAG